MSADNPIVAAIERAEPPEEPRAVVATGGRRDQNGGGTTPKSPSKSRLAPVPFDQIQLATTPRYLVKGLIPREGLIVVWGPPKCGKSFWAFDLVMHVALDWKYRGRRVAKGPVVYVACEGASGFRARVEAYRQRHLAENSTAVPFYLVPATLDLVGEHTQLIAAIRAEVGEPVPVAVVLDTLNRSMRGSENSDEDMSTYIKAADAVREAFECAVIVIHHCGIEGTRPRGHTSLTGAADAQIAIKRDDARTITATVEWMKDGPEGDEIFSRLEPVELGTDDDGEPITSCVIVPADKSDSGTTKRLPAAAKIALDLLVKAINDAGETAPASGTIPSDISVCPVDVWKRYCEAGSITVSDKPDTKDKSFRRASEKLQSLGYIGVWRDYVWITRTSRT